MTDDIETRFMILISGLKLSFGASYVDFCLRRISSLHSGFVDYSVSPTFSVQGAFGPAVAVWNCRCVPTFNDALIVAGYYARYIRHTTVADLNSVPIE